MTPVRFRRHDNGRLEKGELLRILRGAYLVRVEEADGTVRVISTPHVYKFLPPSLPSSVPLHDDDKDDEDDDSARIDAGIQDETISPSKNGPRLFITVPTTHPPAKVLVAPVIYTGFGSAGDYQTIMNDEERMEHTLLVFNGNLEQDMDYGGWDTCAGGGNACARILKDSLMSHGIPTGGLGIGGFTSLDQRVVVRDTPRYHVSKTAKEVIDASVKRLKKIIKLRTEVDPSSPLYLSSPLHILYSADACDGYTLGTGIFQVGQDVKCYITQRLHELTV